MEKKPWEYGPLSACANGRYLQNGTKPFFWLASFHKLSLEDAELYLRNRSEKGFNVIESVLAFRIDGVDQGASELSDPEYWAKCDVAVAVVPREALA